MLFSLFVSSRNALSKGHLSRSPTDITLASALKITISDKFGDIINIQGLVTESYKNVFQTYATYFEKNGSFSEIQMDVYGDETKMRDVNLQFGKSKLADIASAVVSTRPVQASYYPHVIEINPVTLKHL